MPKKNLLPTELLAQNQNFIEEHKQWIEKSKSELINFVCNPQTSNKLRIINTTFQNNFGTETV